MRQRTGGYRWYSRSYEGLGHGFAVRAALGDKVESQGSEDAAGQAVEWFQKYLS